MLKKKQQKNFNCAGQRCCLWQGHWGGRQASFPGEELRAVVLKAGDTQHLPLWVQRRQPSCPLLPVALGCPLKGQGPPQPPPPLAGEEWRGDRDSPRLWDRATGQVSQSALMLTHWGVCVWVWVCACEMVIKLHMLPGKWSIFLFINSG